MNLKKLVLIGERDLNKRGHQGIEASIDHYQRATGKSVSFQWLRSDLINAGTIPTALQESTGIWCVPGSPYASTEGALLGIQHARECSKAFLGTCGGFQHALIEYCAHVLKIPAAHQETNPAAKNPLITKLSCSLLATRARVHVVPSTPYEKIIGSLVSTEEFNCNYGMAPDFEPYFSNSEIEFVVRDEESQVRVFCHRRHPFFFGSLFQPERRALEGQIHPLVHAFLERI